MASVDDFIARQESECPRLARCGEATTWTLLDSANCALRLVLDTGAASVEMPPGMSPFDCAWVNDYICNRLEAMRNG